MVKRAKTQTLDSSEPASRGKASERVWLEAAVVSEIVAFTGAWPNLARLSKTLNAAFWKSSLIPLTKTATSEYLSSQKYREFLWRKMANPKRQLGLNFESVSKLSEKRLAILSECFELKISNCLIPLERFGSIPRLFMNRCRFMRAEVQSEFTPAWEYLRIERSEKLKAAVLCSAAPTLKHLALDHVSTPELGERRHHSLFARLEFLQVESAEFLRWQGKVLPNLKVLEVSGKADVTDPIPQHLLGNCPKLAIVNINRNTATLDFLTNATPCTVVVHRSRDLIDISGLEWNARLRELSLVGSADLVDVTCIGNCTNLEILNLSDTKVENISLLANFHRLRSLVLPVSVTSLQPLQGLRALESFELRTRKLSSLDFLVNSSESLKKLSVTADYVKSVTGLEQLVNLETLELVCHSNRRNDFWLCYCPEHDFRVIGNLRKLRDLKLAVRGLSDGGRFLQDLVKLENLCFKDVRVDDLGHLAGLKKLKVLKARVRNLKSLDSVGMLPELERLELYAPKLQTIEVLSSYPKLSTVRLSENLAKLFSGEVPSTFSFKFKGREFYEARDSSDDDY